MPAAITRLKAVKRIVAVGDLHGDLQATRRALRAAGAIDTTDKWIGGDLVIVQTGDQVDRGDDDRAILELFDRLRDESRAVGGNVVALNGNHEVMNVLGNFDYASLGSLTTFASVTPLSPLSVSRFPQELRARASVFLPGGGIAKRLSERSLIAIINDSVFVHGGLLPEHVRYGLDRMNQEVARWMRGDGPRPSDAVIGDQSPIWTRFYAEDSPRVCDVLAETLQSLNAKRLVIGHTIQRNGIEPACQERLWRIDVGMSKFYGGPVQALIIDPDRVQALRAP